GVEARGGAGINLATIEFEPVRGQGLPVSVRYCHARVRITSGEQDLVGLAGGDVVAGGGILHQGNGNGVRYARIDRQQSQLTVCSHQGAGCRCAGEQDRIQNGTDLCQTFALITGAHYVIECDGANAGRRDGDYPALESGTGCPKETSRSTA